MRRAGTLGFVEFVMIIAALNGLTAFSIDNVLPGFPMVAAEFHLAQANDVQLLVYTYGISFAVMQLAYGPVSDIAGRRPVVLFGVALYMLASALGTFAASFPLLLAARVLQGFGAAAARVVSTAIVRDRYEGTDMARVLSLAMMVTILLPVIAPSIGSLLLLAGSWRTIFASMVVGALLTALWFGVRMPETLHAQHRSAFSARQLRADAGTVLATRQSLGYATATGLVMACLYAYVGSAEQILGGAYRLGAMFPVLFGVLAAVLSIAAFANARLVRVIGLRRLAHAALCGIAALAVLQLGIALTFRGHPPLALFCALIASSLFLFGLMIPNFNALALAPFGSVAGTAASLIGAYTTLTGALLGLFIGRAFDGTIRPLSLGFAGCGVASLAAIGWAERGRLFRTAGDGRARLGVPVVAGVSSRHPGGRSS